jgi:hypothetical protein
VILARAQRLIELNFDAEITGFSTATSTWNRGQNSALRLARSIF